MEHYAIPRVSQVQNTCLLVAISDAIRGVVWSLAVTILNPIDQIYAPRSAPASAVSWTLCLKDYTAECFRQTQSSKVTRGFWWHSNVLIRSTAREFQRHSTKNRVVFLVERTCLHSQGLDFIHSLSRVSLWLTFTPLTTCQTFSRSARTS